MVFACSKAAFALLPPYFQSVKEIEQILTDERLHDILGSGEPIMEIQKMGNSYLIVTSKQSLRVNVIYQPSERPGPAHFELQFEEANDLQHPAELELF